MKIAGVLICFCTFVILSGPFCAPIELYAQVSFPAPELLGRPTENSVTVNVVADAGLQAYFEYGTTPGSYTGQTATISSPANEPIEAVIDGLQPDTRYYYRMVYSENGGSSWVERDEHTFHTQRPPGSTFTFTIISDSHMNGGWGNVALYEQALDNVNEDHPDFHFDLGDTFWTDGAYDIATTNQRYLSQRQWMGAVSHSAAIFLAPGNHENEEGWNLDDYLNAPYYFSKALGSINTRKRYYPNPITDGFYSGNDDTLEEIDGDHLREDYYAWEWGDALFIVIDPYQYTTENPYAVAGGEDDDEGPGSSDRWDWTLGKDQYDWLKETLEYSNAKFKFIFAHHMLGGSEDFVRGGAAAAHMFEWGGYNLDGTTRGFDTERPGWGNVPIHQLMAANGASAFFYGHDHLYAYQKREGIVYQEVPSAGLTGSGLQTYYQNEYTLELLPSPGHLRITVSPSRATVAYVRADTAGGTNGEVAHSYIIFAPCPGDFNADRYVNQDDLTLFAADFGKNDCGGGCEGDFKVSDDDVDGSDLAVMVAASGPCD